VAKKTAVIGAGLAGLSCARTLRRAGFTVDVFEQDRTVGGRLGTIRVGTDSFDHGVQYLSARSAEFSEYLEEIAERGYAERWTPRTSLSGGGATSRVNSWMVGTPGMSSLVRPLAERLDVSTGRRAHALERSSKGWQIWFDDETCAGPFDSVALAVPAADACRLLGRIDELAAPLSHVRMAPCWTLMVRLERRIIPKDVLSNVTNSIRWVARNNSKPRRNPNEETVVIHASPYWSREAQDWESEEVAEELWSEFSHALDLPPLRPLRMTAHLWRHGFVDQALGEPCLYSREQRAGVAGDWCLGGLAENAFESGSHLGRAIASSLM
jgi:predicted NAD/FAD-dependent oxidoreductase